MDKVDIQKEWFLENPKGRLMDKFAKNNLPLFYDIIRQYPGDKFVEKLYNYYEGNEERPKCICGKPLKFQTFTLGYHKFCSQKCSTSSPERSSKIRETTLERYGVGNVSQSYDIKQKKEETSLKHYGVKHFNNREQAKETMKRVYGVENVSKLDDVKLKKKTTLEQHYHGDISPIQEKMRETCLKKYGVDNVFKLDSVRKNTLSSYYKLFLQNNPIVEEIIREDDITYKCKCPHPGCTKCEEKNFLISAITYNNRKYSDGEMCTKLLPPNENRLKNTSLEIFIKNLLEEYNIKYITNDRKILNGKELDIFIPSKNVAIECNGCRWHSFLFKSQTYHKEKFDACLENNIQLLTFWEDQIKNNPQKIRSILLSKLGIYDKRIFARKCIIKELKANICQYWLTQWHLQGSTGASVRLGLYLGDELVSIMTFCRRKLFVNNDWELVRYCVKPGCQVIGGASKLMNYFIKLFNPKKIISFSSNDISNGNLYKQLGFENKGETLSYWYVDKNLKRYHRYNYRKSELIKKGYDAKKSEFEITNDMGLLRIYDSGMTRWEKHP